MVSLILIPKGFPERCQGAPTPPLPTLGLERESGPSPARTGAGSSLHGCLWLFRGLTPPPRRGELTGLACAQPVTGARARGLAAGTQGRRAGDTSLPRLLPRRPPARWLGRSQSRAPTVTPTPDGEPASCSRAPASWTREAICGVRRLSCPSRPSMPQGPRLETPKQPRPQHPHLPEAPSSLPLWVLGRKSILKTVNVPCGR